MLSNNNVYLIYLCKVEFKDLPLCIVQVGNSFIGPTNGIVWTLCEWYTIKLAIHIYTYTHEDFQLEMPFLLC